MPREPALGGTFYDCCRAPRERPVAGTVAPRPAVGAVRVWGEGRYALRGALGYTTGGGGNREFGGGVNFTMRF